MECVFSWLYQFKLKQPLFTFCYSDFLPLTICINGQVKPNSLLLYLSLSLSQTHTHSHIRTHTAHKISLSLSPFLPVYISLYPPLFLFLIYSNSNCSKKRWNKVEVLQAVLFWNAKLKKYSLSFCTLGSHVDKSQK